METEDVNVTRWKADFEVWARECVRIRHKLTGEYVPFELNTGQRKLLAAMERQRLAEKPIRVIVLKSRQWGCSTLVQIYMAWIQLLHRENWNSLICAHVRDTAGIIRNMYGRLLAAYPEAAGGPVKFTPFEGSRNVRFIPERGSTVTICSSENPEATRGGDYAMAHLSEVAYWRRSPLHDPEQIVQNICSSVPRVPLSVVVMESTANGPNNYFHSEWGKAVDGRSDKTAVFVPWHEIDLYREALDRTVEEMTDDLDAYERQLLADGLDPEQVWWYHNKRREYPSHTRMMAEFPSTPDEAFNTSLPPVFDAVQVEEQMAGCEEPVMRGDLTGAWHEGKKALEGVKFVESPAGPMEVWEPPCPAEEAADYRPGAYVVTVDVGGRSPQSDWSVIAVTDARPTVRGGAARVVAQWRGHIDHDLLAWKAAQVAQWYDNARLVIESNSLEGGSGEGDYVMDRLSRAYRNMYVRTSFNSVTHQFENRFGFHTNRATKCAAINDFIAALREGRWEERSLGAATELSNFVEHPDGHKGGAPGCHDDMAMTRIITAHVLARQGVKRISC